MKNKIILSLLFILTLQMQSAYSNTIFQTAGSAILISAAYGAGTNFIKNGTFFIEGVDDAEKAKEIAITNVHTKGVFTKLPRDIYNTGFTNKMIKASYSYIKNKGKSLLNNTDQFLTETFPNWLENQNKEIKQMNNKGTYRFSLFG